MSLIAVDEALRLVLEGVEPIAETEVVPLAAAAGRTLARDVVATRDQPPFAASAMDGYAVRAGDARPGEPLRVVGESVAGRRYTSPLGPGEAVRIFTGAPVPEGADAILIQEDARREGDRVVPLVVPSGYVRPAALDFAAGEVLLRAGATLDAGRIALLAAANAERVEVRRRPRVAIISTGDELVPLGATPGPDQIVASSVHGVSAILSGTGAEVTDAGIALDREAELDETIARATADDPHLVVTLGGASVGDHDLVAGALQRRGVEMAFERIAMRPGKPLMHGRGDGRLWLGLPGNPVSSLVCSHLFVAPLVSRLAGRRHRQRWIEAELATDLPANDRREDYLRVVLSGSETVLARPTDRQDSSQLTRFAAADGLLVRPPHAPSAARGTRHRTLVLRDWE